MKVISTFLFAEKHEENVLWTKLNCESEGIDEWIIIESPFSFRGNPKPVNVKEILQQERFSPFLDRIFVITIENNLFAKYCKNHCEKDYFLVEYLSRKSCFSYLDENYKDEDKIFVADVDELIDFSDKNRKREFFKICCEYNGAWQAKQLKFWWDFNNLSFYPKYMPIHTLGSLRSGSTSFEKRNDNCKMISSNKILAFEYAYSFSPEENFSKCSTFSHDRYNQECIYEALRGNSWHKTRERNELLGEQIWDWFETIELNEDNAPLFILENLNKLKVNTVNPDYAEFRIKKYGIQPHPALNFGLLGDYKIAKHCNYYKR